MKFSLTLQSCVLLCLLLGSLSWNCGCAMGIPSQNIPPRGKAEGMPGSGLTKRQIPGEGDVQGSQSAKSLSGLAIDRQARSEGTSAGQFSPAVKSTVNRSPYPPNQSKPTETGKNTRGLASSRRADSNQVGKSKQPGKDLAITSNSATNVSLGDSPVPNPLRSAAGAKPNATVPNSTNRYRQPITQSPVQTVGYQEEIPIVSGEQIPRNSEAITRIAMLEEPELAEPTPASVLESGEPEPVAGEGALENIPAENLETEQQLPLDESSPQQEIPIVSSPVQGGFGGGNNPATSAANAQGHYEQGTAVYGQLLNEPQPTASQRAIQLLDENQRLREEMKSKLKELENAQAKLRQQDELWARARQEFLEVRGVVDNLTKENSLLKMQIEKLESEKVELARQYQGLMQTVEQTLDDLLLKAITQPPATNPPATAPATVPATAPATVPATVPAPSTQPPPAPPIVTGQQASALLKSQQ